MKKKLQSAKTLGLFRSSTIPNLRSQSTSQLCDYMSAMVPLSAHGRRRPESDTVARKRRRTNKIPSKKSDTSRKNVALDSLPWSLVPLPDRLDDAEGFFGLEEISDVEVSRNAMMGTIEYRVGEEA